jgi:hypothetical protein
VFPLLQGDIVLLGLREYQDEKADVIMKFTADEARVLKQYGELPEHIRCAHAHMLHSIQNAVASLSNTPASHLMVQDVVLAQVCMDQAARLVKHPDSHHHLCVGLSQARGWQVSISQPGCSHTTFACACVCVCMCVCVWWLGAQVSVS